MSDSLDLDPDAKYKETIPELKEVEQKDYDPLQDLLYVRSVRGQVLKAVAGKGLPKNKEDLTLVVSLLNDIDRSAIGQLRIKSDEKGQDLQSQHQALVRAFLAGSGGFKAPLRTSNTDVPSITLDDSISTREFVPGELLQGTINDNFENFVGRTGAVELAKEDAPD